jgi:hypothetical protein
MSDRLIEPQYIPSNPRDAFQFEPIVIARNSARAGHDSCHASEDKKSGVENPESEAKLIQEAGDACTVGGTLD